MITRDAQAFVAFANTCAPDLSPATARAAFLVSPEGFALAEQSASDNAYMDLSVRVDPERALAQHRGLQQALAKVLPTIGFPGDPKTPDALFPNNVFATAKGRLILGHMRHCVRQAEAERRDIRGFFRDVLGYEELDLRAQPGICELTGSMVIDHRRGLGFCGLSERCDEVGAAAMLETFGLRGLLMYDLAPGEYHGNVVMSVLAGRALVIAASGFADPAVAETIAQLYEPHSLRIDAAEKAAFAGNCIAVSEEDVFMSASGVAALRPENHQRLAAAGLRLHAVDLSEIEKAGGSLRCCVAEIW
jgi:hypothetical protein